jgi:hypothetical protein
MTLDHERGVSDINISSFVGDLEGESDADDDMHQTIGGGMKTSAGGGGGSGGGGRDAAGDMDATLPDTDLAAFLKHLVTGQEAADNDDKALHNVWDALDGGLADTNQDDMEGHNIFLHEETDKVLVRGATCTMGG